MVPTAFASARRRQVLMRPCDNPSVILRGRRTPAGDAWVHQGWLARTAGFLRGHTGLVPRGVYVFDSFEEADAWMTRMIVATHERLRPKTPFGSPGR